MEQRLLLPIQMTEVFALIVRARLEPAAFHWSVVDCRFDPDVRIHRLESSASPGAAFEFHQDAEGHAAWSRPGSPGPSAGAVSTGSWESQLGAVHRWLLSLGGEPVRNP